MIAVYNEGAYGKTGKLARQGGYPNPYQLAEAIKNAGNSITPKYISRLMGKEGYYDLLMTDLKPEIAKYQPRPETQAKG